MIRREYLGNLVFCSVLAFFLSYLEYYYVTLDGIPYREMCRADLLNIPPYVLFPLIPVLAGVAFFPLVNDLLLRRIHSSQMNRQLTISAANFLWALTLHNTFYYFLRARFPLPTDPLAGLWITPGEAPLLGLVNLLGILWPTWYFATIPATISIYVACHVS